jgi:pseudaminic acid cytidylyltransferase
MSKVNIDSTLVIIPARGGSKRIPDKNIRIISGQPMILWPLMEIQNIFNKDNILITTDSKAIKSVVEDIGIKVPFIRPKYLSDDFTLPGDAVKHALNWFEINIKKMEYVLTIYPTAVLLNKKDIYAAMKILEEDEMCDSVMTATYFPYPIQRAIYQNKDGYAVMFEPDNYTKRSQDLIPAIHDAGQFYLSRAEKIRSGAQITNSRVKVHLLHRKNVIDIDTLEDFEIAEEKLNFIKKIKNNL